jgi:hypothetical protein
MADDDDDDRATNPLDAFLLSDAPIPDVTLPGQDALQELGRELEATFDGVTPDPSDIERALDSVEIPNTDNLDFEATALSDVSLDPSDADLLLDMDGEIVDAAVGQSEDVVEIALDQSEEGGELLLDVGDEVIEIAIEGGGEMAEVGGEVAAEVVVEVIAEALEGV